MTTIAELRPIVDRLHEQGIPADFDPPLEAPIPRWDSAILFGEPDEGRYPYRLELDGNAITITDNHRDLGDPIAMGTGDPITLCTEVLNRDQYLDDDGVSLVGRCGWCNKHVDNFTPGHRVTSVLHGGKGVECVANKDITDDEAAPLARMGMPT